MRSFPKQNRECKELVDANLEAVEMLQQPTHDLHASA